MSWSLRQAGQSTFRARLRSTKKENWLAKTISPQAAQVFANIDAALKAAHASFADVVKLTFYVTDVTKVPALRIVRDKYVDTAHPPASTLVEVRRLVRDDLLLEVEATAVVEANP